MSSSASIEVAVPSKIVIVGTSSMSLNDRFAKIKPPAPKVTVLPVTRGSMVNVRAKQRAAVADVDDYEDDDMMEMGNGVMYDPTYAALARTQVPTIRRQRQPMYRAVPVSAVPIQDRISFDQPVMYVPSMQRIGYNRGRAGFRSNVNRFGSGGGFTNGFKNYSNGLATRNNFNNAGFRSGASFNNYRGRGRGQFQRMMGNRGQQQKQSKYNAAELDRELDSYMKKPGTSKHPQITA